MLIHLQFNQNVFLFIKKSSSHFDRGSRLANLQHNTSSHTCITLVSNIFNQK